MAKNKLLNNLNDLLNLAHVLLLVLLCKIQKICPFRQMTIFVPFIFADIALLFMYQLLIKI